MKTLSFALLLTVFSTSLFAGNTASQQILRLRNYILWRHPDIPQGAIDQSFQKYFSNTSRIKNRSVIFINDLTKPRDALRFYRIEMGWDPLTYGIDPFSPGFPKNVLKGFKKFSDLPTPVHLMYSAHGYGSIPDSANAFNERYATQFGNRAYEGLSSLGAFITGAKGHFVKDDDRPRVLLYGIDRSNSKAYTRKVYFHAGTDGDGNGWKQSGTYMNGNSAGCIVVSEQDYKFYENYLDKNRGTLMMNWYDADEQRRYMDFDARIRYPAMLQQMQAQQTQDGRLWQAAARNFATTYLSPRY